MLYPHSPQAPDELELISQDFITVEESEIENSPDGWFKGMSWLTGLLFVFFTSLLPYKINLAVLRKESKEDVS